MNKFLIKDWMGVVLCGGKPSGAIDRGLIKFNDRELVLHTENLLSSVLPTTVVSVNEAQFPLYKKKFQNMELIMDSNKINGPLSGIMSVYSAYRVFQFIVLSCDMVFINSEMIRDLQSRIKKSPGFDFYVYSRGNSVEPFCAIYTSEGLEKIYNLYNQGSLRNTGIREAILMNRTSIQPIKEEYFDNFEVYREKVKIA